MTLRLAYLNGNRLWADILSAHGDGVFVATTEPPHVGDTVSILIEAPNLPAPLSLSAVIQGHRPQTGTLAAGVLVRFDPPSLERCRIALLGEGPVRTTGRQAVRADCSLTLRFVTPQGSGPVEVKSLSVTGFTVKTTVPLSQLMKVTAVLMLPDRKEVSLAAQVVWIRPELELAGFQITTIEAQAQIAEAVNALAAAPQPSSGVTIVVADDDPSILTFAFTAISRLGHRVLRADRGDTALQLIRQERPRLVFLDVLMPGLDGLEVCKAMRSDEHLNRIPVVLLSAMGESRLKEAARQAGANDFLTKPMHLEALRALVAKHVA